MQGKVKWFDVKKGFGFITPDEGGKDVFVHYKQIEGQGFKNLAEGEIVEFGVEQSERGPSAVGVRKQ